MARRKRPPIRCGKSVEWYDAQLRAQGGGCAICGKLAKWFKHRFAVDHNHKTNLVRGLLCYVCNRMVLGRVERFRIDPRRIVAYFEKYDPDYLKQFDRRTVEAKPN